MTWHRRSMALCDHISQWSEDRDLQVGCIIFSPNGHEIRSTGHNRLARGVASSDPARFDRPSCKKFFWFEHAERNAICNAARGGVRLEGYTLYVNRFPCADCGRAIIQSVIRNIDAPPIPNADGAPDYSFKTSLQMLREAGGSVAEFAQSAGNHVAGRQARA